MKKYQPDKSLILAKLTTIARDVDLMIEEWVDHFIKQVENDNHKNSNNNG